MTKEALQQRLEQLKSERLQVFAQINAFDGAIQDCEFWIAQLERDEKIGREARETDKKAKAAKTREEKIAATRETESVQ